MPKTSNLRPFRSNPVDASTEYMKLRQRPALHRSQPVNQTLVSHRHTRIRSLHHMLHLTLSPRHATRRHYTFSPSTSANHPNQVRSGQTNPSQSWPGVLSARIYEILSKPDSGRKGGIVMKEKTSVLTSHAMPLHSRSTEGFCPRYVRTPNETLRSRSMYIRWVRSNVREDRI